MFVWQGLRVYPRLFPSVTVIKYLPGWFATCLTPCSQGSVLSCIFLHLCLQYMTRELLDVSLLITDVPCTWVLGLNTLQARGDVNFQICISQTPVKISRSWEPRLWNKLSDDVDSAAVARICFALCLLFFVTLGIIWYHWPATLSKFPLFCASSGLFTRHYLTAQQRRKVRLLALGLLVLGNCHARVFMELECQAF